MMQKHALTTVALLCCGGASLASAATAPDLKEWKTEGDANLDPGRSHVENNPSIKVGPGGKAIQSRRDQDGSGRVTLWIYDDKTAPADPKTKRAGPRCGVVQRDGAPLIVGMLYAPYLGGETGYSVSDTWTWQAATGRFAAATLQGVRPGVFDVTVDARTGAPTNK